MREAVASRAFREAAAAIRRTEAERLFAISHHDMDAPVVDEIDGRLRGCAIGRQIARADHPRCGDPEPLRFLPQRLGGLEISIRTAEQEDGPVQRAQMCPGHAADPSAAGRSMPPS